MMSSTAHRVAAALFGLLVLPAVAFAAPHPPPHPPSAAAGGHLPMIVGGVALGLVVVGVIVWRASRGGKKAVAPGAGDPFQQADQAFQKEMERALGPSANPSAPKSPWQQKVLAAARAAGKDPSLFWDYNNPAARNLVGSMLAEVAARLGSGQVKEAPEMRELELRGTYAGAPFRFSVDLSFGSVRRIEMQCDNRVGPFMVKRDMETVPKPVDPNDPWDKEGTQRVFLAKGVFIEGHGPELIGGAAVEMGGRDIEGALAAWRSVPPQAQASILAELGRLGLGYVGATTQGVRIAGAWKLQNVDDPVDALVASAKVLELLKNGVSSGTYVPNAAGSPAAAAAPVQRATCKYCRSMFLVAVGTSACPNCGANATA